MNLVVINGSPRKGNTRDLLDAFIKGTKDARISYIDMRETTVLPCEACNSCTVNEGRCKHDDATNDILEKIKNADGIVFGMPVYWWGVSAQIKAVIDKMYAFNAIGYKLPGKKIGIITVGAEAVGAKQYQLISDQFKCICSFLKWDIQFDESFSAYKIGDIRKDTQSLMNCEELYKKLI